MDWIESHIRTLVHSAGLSEDAARTLFLKPVRVILDPEVRGNRTYELAYSTTVNLVSRIFPLVKFEPLVLKCMRTTAWGKFEPLQSDFAPPRLTIRIGGSAGATDEINLVLNDWRVFINGACPPARGEPWNPLLAIIGASYATAAAAVRLLDGALLGAIDWPQFSILDFQDANAVYDFDQPISIGHLHLAGVGAVGSAFLYCAAAHGRIEGQIDLLDTDIVDKDNLGRYPLFDASHLGFAKVIAATHALAFMRNLELDPYQERLQDHTKRQLIGNPGFRISGLISAPDRRETRRLFQHEFPRQLWDASTGTDQVVVHTNSYNPRFACAECIYPAHASESAHLEHLAEVLDVPLDELKKGTLITPAAARKIANRYPHLDPDELVGLDYDSVFRDLCSASQLRAGDEFVLAPMPFVSMLAGAYLYLEFLKTFPPTAFQHVTPTNYYQLNPLFPPNPLLRELRGPRVGCTCQNPAYRAAFQKVWQL